MPRPIPTQRPEDEKEAPCYDSLQAVFDDFENVLWLSTHVKTSDRETRTPVISTSYFSPDLFEIITRRSSSHGTLMGTADAPGPWLDLDVLAWAILKADLCRQPGVDRPVPDVRLSLMVRRVLTAHERCRARAADDSETTPTPDSNGTASEAKGASHPAEAAQKPVLLTPMKAPAPPPAAVPKPKPKPKGRFAHTLVNAAEIELALKGDGTDRYAVKQRELIKAFAERPVRVLLPANRRHLWQVTALRNDFPHFAPLIDQVLQDLQLLVAGRAPLALSPILLVGPPGIGKTAFVLRLGTALGLDSAFVSIGGVSAGWVLKGNHGTWANAKPGIIAERMIRLQDRRGLLLQLDELDKVSGRSASSGSDSIEPVLLELLEPLQSERFVDEYLGITLNLRSMLSVLATANRLAPIPPAVLSRFRVVQLGAPTAQQMPAVVRSVDLTLRSERSELERLFEPLDQAVVSSLTALPPRTLKRLLEAAYSLAAARPPPAHRRKRQVGTAEIAAATQQMKAAATAVAGDADPGAWTALCPESDVRH